MTLRFLIGVGVAAAVATGLVKRYRKQVESAGAGLAADAAIPAPSVNKPVAASPAPVGATLEPVAPTVN